MNFFIPYKSQFQENYEIDHFQNIVLLGSCFSENMKLFFDNAGFHCWTSPHGIIYNPVSIEILLTKISQNKAFDDAEIVNTTSNFSSYLLHSSFNFGSKNELNDNFISSGSLFKTSDKPSTFIITLGTAWVYQLKDTGLLCANCHKLPQHLFDKRLLTQPEMEMSLESIVKVILGFNPENKVIYTLSPVRHLKDGFVENQQSKSVLHLAIQEVCKKRIANYFPAYEMMMDELRDYRFYKEDMIHPNLTAIKHIWGHFMETFFGSTTKEIVEKCVQFKQLENHKVLSKEDSKMKQHQQQVNNLKKAIKETYPFLAI